MQTTVFPQVSRKQVTFPNTSLEKRNKPDDMKKLENYITTLCHFKMYEEMCS